MILASLFLFLTAPISSVGINDLLKIKWKYHKLCVDPCLDDSITTGIEKVIKNKIDGIVNLRVHEKNYPPEEVYVVTHINPSSYRCVLENGYADDSLHLSEFLVGSISYKESDFFEINLNDNFRFAVEPRIYFGNNWETFKVKNQGKNNFNLPAGLSNVVLFSIIEEKSNPTRKFKVFWLANYDGTT
ncbi:hypothetical protein A2276_01680 [candidate division WOR-1 bacterium RIFOXYA12_FULL_43_27]|uniref:Uncharacterized protein n=1 Tax=candidate division WOR-1 bacterium RIFOXYC2_FULL_46_14 TaxID=1802587 RepID=A0A1F4U6W3_UNCSA|nr:MAG: hypothetical protein A2276_01680 [candidate division WOR-1 bacterium RIFOXYA12_FULL_43_27]OGC19564.1 MAG: hypothetical protein A2292_02650 [candidate division WOR-1 bacterium RIFOXYB2_FULL_46_45]OGC30552.1 MAG: hypothetical protein A2232_02650 [candidate division WOR-1 bacterium RIFOXYA2_FULL_46_56]OGC40619.1 MAG: hypothetical protein A2438_06365 [candidate division WOR-1 bacterium RIFOXYC2_FULL_46_14]